MRKPVLLFRLRYAAVVLVAAAGPASAAEWDYGLGPSLQYFHYQEESQGRVLNEETGWLPGVRADLERRAGGWFMRAAIEHHQGEVDYDGESNIGTPLTTTSDAAISDLILDLGGILPQETGELRWFAGAGYHRWLREIASTSSVSGVDETYRWPYWHVGAEYRWDDDSHRSWSASFRVRQPVASEVKVDFRGLYDTIELPLGERPGVRLQLGRSWALPSGHVLRAEGWLDYSRIGRGPSRDLLRNGAPAGTVFEPDSDTWMLGLSLLIGS